MLKVRYFLLFLFLTSCAAKHKNTFYVLNPLTSQHCQYQTSAASIPELTDPDNFNGTLGKIFYSDKILTEETDFASLFDSLTGLTALYKSENGGRFPLNQSTLAGYSIYHSLSRSLNLLTTTDAQLLSNHISSFRNIQILYKFRFQSNGTSQLDNAEYYALPNTDHSYYDLFLLYQPGSSEHHIPVYFNTGIVAHEFFHLIFQRMVLDTLELSSTILTPMQRSKIASINEGLADYFGYLVAEDPNFASCSFEAPDRDVSVKKVFQTKIENTSQEDFDEHEFGSVIASAMYQTGLVMGHHKTLAALLNILKMPNECIFSKQEETFKLFLGCVSRTSGSEISLGSLGVYQ